MLVGYARVSTTDQAAGLEAQRRELAAAGAERLFEEEVSSVDRDGRAKLVPWPSADRTSEAEEVRRLVAGGLSPAEAAKRCGIGRSSAYRALAPERP